MIAKFETYRGRDLDGHAVSVTVNGQVIESVEEIEAEDLPLIAPPLVDLQQNGALGYAFDRLGEVPETLAKVAKHVRRHGVGRMLATFTTHPYEKLLKSLAELDRQLKADPDLERLYFGAFFEGIYMSREDGWRGVHNPDYMRDPSWEEWERLVKASGNRIKVFNVDPERPGAIEAIRQAKKHGIRVAMGHCGPDPESIRAAVEAGADMVTHFGNGAPVEVHRHRNPFWTWLVEDSLHIGLIADGHHLPGDLIQAAIAAKGRDKVYLVSDASGHSGMPAGEYDGFVIEEDGYTHLPGKEILAASWHQADRCVERLCQLGWRIEDAWRQQSEIPARIIGIDLPRLEPGQPAEFVLSSFEGGSLHLQQVVSMGRELLKEEIHPQMV